MNKKFISPLCIMFSFLLIVTLSTGCGKKASTTVDNNTTVKTVKIKLNEVARSVFYAPMYAAIKQGFFKEQGIEIDLSTGQGADKTMQQVLSGSDDIGFCGPEQVIYIYNQNKENYPVIFNY